MYFIAELTGFKKKNFTFLLLSILFLSWRMSLYKHHYIVIYYWDDLDNVGNNNTKRSLNVFLVMVLLVTIYQPVNFILYNNHMLMLPIEYKPHYFLEVTDCTMWNKQSFRGSWLFINNTIRAIMLLYPQNKDAILLCKYSCIWAHVEMI